MYGINMHNSGLVIFDRFSLENGNSVVFAKSGAGKSFTVKLEALRSLMFGTEIFIIDPENEYERMCRRRRRSLRPAQLEIRAPASIRSTCPR